MNSGPTLSEASRGPDVRRLQVILVMVKSLDVSGIDGVFGSKTQDAVKSFQQGNNLTADGIVGPLTWAALPADPQNADTCTRFKRRCRLRIAKGIAGVRRCQYRN